MKSSDLINLLKDQLEAGENTPSGLRVTLTDAFLWSLIKRAIPDLPEYRGVWGRHIFQNQFQPYYTPNTDTLSLDPLQFKNDSNVVVNNDVYLSSMPGSGSVELVPNYEMISPTEADAVKADDFSWRRNIYCNSKTGGYVSLYDYVAVTHGAKDGYFYRLAEYEGILSIKLELVTEDVNAEQGAGVDVSVDGGRTWLSDLLSLPVNTEIDVSAYPSSSLSVKINLASSTATSPKVKDLRVLVWSIENLDANVNYVLKLAKANYYEELALRATGASKQETADMMASWAWNLRKDVAGYFDKGEPKMKETGPVRVDGPRNVYENKYFTRRR